jgi:hypothetical protein
MDKLEDVAVAAVSAPGGRYEWSLKLKTLYLASKPPAN